LLVLAYSAPDLLVQASLAPASQAPVLLVLAYLAPA
jgi:hypothetical protein